MPDVPGPDGFQGFTQPRRGLDTGARHGGSQVDEQGLDVLVALFLGADLLHGFAESARVRVISEESR